MDDRDNADEAEARRIMAAFLAGEGGPGPVVRALTVRPIPGHSNRVFEVGGPGGRYALRLPRPEDRGLPRLDEERAAREAWRLGVGARPALIDPGRGIALTHWIEGARPVTAADLAGSPARLRQAFSVIARFHARATGLRRPIDIRGALEAAVAMARAAGALPAFWPQIAPPCSRALRRLLARGSLVPSHGDPTPGNFLKACGRLCLIDWEYAGLAPPAWDFGYLAFEAGVTPSAAARLAGRDAPPETDIARAMLAAGALNTIWYAQAGADRGLPAGAIAARWRRLRVLARLQAPGQ
jgi:aminoglycoside phosphotransferase (APT) family kinase protein